MYFRMVGKIRTTLTLAHLMKKIIGVYPDINYENSRRQVGSQRENEEVAYKH